MAKPHRKLFPLTPQEISIFWFRVDKTPGQGPQGECWEWQGKRIPAGYGQYEFEVGATGAHRVAYYLNTGNDPGPLLVCHHCDNPPCCNPFHLFPDTHQGNMDDARRKGRTAIGTSHWAHLHPEKCSRGAKHGAYTHPEKIARGEKQKYAKLTDDKVRQIRKALETGIKGNAIARELAVSKSLVSLVKLGRIWKHVTS